MPLIVVDDKPVKLTGVEDGRLSDIAPTILSMMGVERPAEMTGRVLACEALLRRGIRLNLRPSAYAGGRFLYIVPRRTGLPILCARGEGSQKF